MSRTAHSSPRTSGSGSFPWARRDRSGRWVRQVRWVPKGETGAPGATGEQGLQGLKGDPGPTAASASPSTRDAPAVPYNNDAVDTITTTTAGKLWTQGVDTYTASACTNGKYSLALFLDDAYAPGTRRDQPLAETIAQSGSVPTFGVAESVPAGDHTIVLRSLMTGCAGSYGTDSQVGAIAIG